MSARHIASPRRNCLTTALLVAFIPFSGSVLAQEQGRVSDLDRVVVTGSLIPQTQKETFVPITVISAEDIQGRGFSSVAEVLQQSSFATGGIQGGQSSASFTQGAEAASMFGLKPSYTKYLINGRPMADYPALYNGSDTFNNISGIPVDLVERIEILPGGQSSLYGSDAIAGVINVILKKNVDATTISVRAGTYTDGGGNSGRVTFATGFGAADGRLNGVLGAQYESSDPIWAYQRDLTRQFNRNGSTPALASRDWLVNSPFTSYKFLDPANCANLGDAFDGTVGAQTRPGFGDETYCGSLYTPGYRTLKNSKDSGQVYSHVTYEFSDNARLYVDALYNEEKVKYHIGSGYTWWGTEAQLGAFYDPDLADFVNLQRAFAPEEMGQGGFRNTMSEDKTKSWQLTVGVDGTFGASSWDYDVGVTSTRYELRENSFARFADPIYAYFAERVLGPSLGVDPEFGEYPVFRPDYAAFYTLMSPEDFRSFTGYTTTRSKTSNDMLRAQLTNSDLFSLPGGSAGLAVAMEYGQEEWTYRPDERLLNGEVWGTTSVDGGGERDRMAAIAELRLPLLEQLTASVSGRYDRFEPSGAQDIDKSTYSIGLEYRPAESFLLRGKYGTAFKAPTLADQFQAASGYYNFVPDFYNCQLLGFGPANVDQCPAVYSDSQYFGTTEGSRDLQPLNADVWNVGAVWAPTPTFSLTADYFRWDIEDEVASQDARGLALREMFCRTGAGGYDIGSPVCVDALSKITRDSLGFITEIYTPKVNEAKRVLEAVNVAANYTVGIGQYGDLVFRGSYTNNLKHELTSFDGDAPIDLLRNPGWSSDPKSKANASVTWRVSDWSTTLYANRVGHTPNYRARLIETYDDPTGAAGKLSPFTTYNMSVSYAALDQLDLSLSVSNLLNDMPPEDRTYPGTSGAPYNDEQYSAYGRAVYLEARYRFGAR